HGDGPTALRYPKTALGDDLPALRRIGVVDVLAEPAEDTDVDVLIVAVVEDNIRSAGVGSAVALALGDADVDVPVRRFGIPEQFLAHAKRGEVLADIGLTPVEVAGRISACLATRNERSKEKQE
ncbi:MAG: 1-deoxy-D-xylulose-5-phosphate synthase, partial [Streptomyces sp.]|nr:1-deoxy-D-xylulose-5-phosphate synthase [Streptomyces sp.]